MRYLLLPWVTVLCCCTPKPSKKIFTIQGQTMGTTYQVKFVAPLGFAKASLKKKIESSLAEVNRQMSTYLPDSEISQVNSAKRGEELSISSWFGETLSLSLTLAKKTQGAFDPTIGPLVNLWGFGPKKHQKTPPHQTIENVKKFVGYEKVTLEKKHGWTVKKSMDQVSIDLSASAKGFGVDIVSRLLQKEGLKNHLVEIGGELRSQGTKPSAPWVVAIEKPTPEGRSIQTVLPLKDHSLATSGNYRNFFISKGKVFPHSIDRDSGRPVSHSLLSVSIIHKDCVVADALATALMVMGTEKALKYAQDNHIAAFFIIGTISKSTPLTRTVMTPTFKVHGRL